MFNLSITAIPDVDLPAPPSDLIEMLTNYMDDKDVPLDQQIMIRESKFKIKERNDIWKEWVIDNITDKFLRTSIQSYSSDLAPHRDIVRNYSLMFLVHAGGPRVQTSFYDPLPGVEIFKSVYPESEIQLRDSFVFSEGSWNLINNKCIHGVKGLFNSRTSLAIDFFETDPPDFIKDQL